MLTVTVDSELEVIFVVDQSYRPSDSKFLKGKNSLSLRQFFAQIDVLSAGLATLVHAIHKQFLEDGYRTIKFGLVGFRGRSYRYEPQQHTVNG